MKTALSNLKQLYTSRIKNKTTNLWGVLVLVCTFLLILDAIYLFFILQNDFYEFNAERTASIFGLTFMLIAGALLLFKAGFFIYMLYRYFCYKPIVSVSDN